MGIYADRVLPRLIHWSMRQSVLAEYRRRVVSAAEGRVLEIGIGSGLNFSYYDSARIVYLLGLDPSPRLLSTSKGTAAARPRLTALVAGSAEAIPLEDDSVNTVVATWTLCSIPDVRRALGEVRRVLEPEGRLVFVEHGRSPDPGVMRWQERLTPHWKRLAGGCHLDRAIDQLIEQCGFRIQRLETGYMRGPKPLTFMDEGWARPR